MLQSLSIKNYALLSDVEIDFGRGLNILTGETGAGKSIIIGALGTILGDRVDMSVLRQGGSKAIIEGRFAIDGLPALKHYLKEQDLAAEYDDLILRREIYDTSRSRAFVNDTPVQLSVLQKISDLLVDLHGQHEHQSLLKVQNHLNFIDEFGGFEVELREVGDRYRCLQKLHSGLKKLQEQQTLFEEKKDLYAFQIQEIDKVNPSEDEEEELLREEKIVRNSERLYNLSHEYFKILYEDENSVYDMLSRVEHGLHELQDIDEQFANCRNECDQARITVEELAKFFEDYKSRVEFNPQRLEEIQTRLSQLTGLKKKFGPSIAEVIAHRNKLQSELDNIENLDNNIEQIKQEINTETEKFTELCQRLSEKRQEVRQRLEQIVPEILSYLGMSSARFNVALKYQDDPNGMISVRGKNYLATATGMDFAEFFISANKGEDVRPLAKVASGGEISRIMLALKSVVANAGHIPVMVFDEIDIGVSGRVAQAVGKKLKELAKYRQIICITHLPQIASLADHHYSVKKQERNGRTETSILKLSQQERTEEIAKLLAGEKVSEAHLNSARELLEDASVGEL
ncbi:DNA repair protein RecN [candidate division KSB1 bacterium]|nr:DNA repair protein RecN [candidate division KSB1 bacterium]NIR73352.1 DNA repair protein RecN [candidate division KSB1 bacterium]NIS25232.1 DNA repair protein RecN [candidate division KSB1 bacterium]NIT72135.1 DNA repair protein RecN [candidate division KSB1 bacterium]NIU25941.1 DNA repair protein RecN [candidate division KSB1 bacterium]